MDFFEFCIWWGGIYVAYPLLRKRRGVWASIWRAFCWPVWLGDYLAGLCQFDKDVL